MSIKLTVPTIACAACVNTLTQAIAKADSNAKVEGDVEHKTLTIQTQLGEAEIIAAIEKAGHEVA